MTHMRISMAAAAAAGLLFGWQAGLAPMNVTEDYVRQEALSTLLRSMRNPPNVEFFASNPARKIFLTLSPQQRTTAAEAVAAIVKPLMLSSETQKAWYAELAKRGGVNHGINLTETTVAIPTSEAAINKMMDDSKKQMLEGRLMEAQRFAKEKQQLTPDILKIFIETDIGMLADADSMFAASPAAQKVAMAKLKEAMKLVSSNPAEAQKALADSRFLAVGIKPDSAGMAEAANQVAQNQNAEKQRREQQTYNESVYGPTMRKQLEQLIAIAATVDFQAATQKKGTRLVFVNPAYEGKNHDWKLLYRAGKGPTTVAVAAAKQVLASLPK